VLLFAAGQILKMSCRRELCLEEKMNLITEKDRGLSHRQLGSQFQISVGAVSNISKQKSIFDYFKSSTVVPPSNPCK
jgi:hypothetical protein